MTGDRSLILEGLGDVAYERGLLQDALDAWGQAALLLDPDSAPLRVAELRRKIGNARWVSGETDEALAQLGIALAVLAGDLGTLQAARAYQELGRIHARLGNQLDAEQSTGRALSLGTALTAADVIAHALITTGLILTRTDKVDEAVTYIHRGLHTALTYDVAPAACRAYTNLAVICLGQDEARSREFCRAGLAVAERIANPLHQAWLRCVRVLGRCAAGEDDDRATEAASTILALDERLGHGNHLPIPLIILAQIHGCRGEYRQSDVYYRRALAAAARVGEPQFLIACYDGLATLAIEGDAEGDADGWLAKSRAIEIRTGWQRDNFLAFPFLC